jgi:hypothetical protein
MQLSAAQCNYPVHEKELLAIIHALEKWCNELLGYPIMVYTDHHIQEYFHNQQHLSRRQARWQEFMSQFELKIVYLHTAFNKLQNDSVEMYFNWSLTQKQFDSMAKYMPNTPITKAKSSVSQFPFHSLHQQYSSALSLSE